MTQQENHANADKLSIQKIIFFVNDSVSIRQEATFCVERWRERNVFCTERESFGFSGKCFTGRRCSLLTDKREPERTAVPGGHESPSGALSRRPVCEANAACSARQGRSDFDALEPTGCGTLRLLRALGGTRILQAAAPTAPPCIRRWRDAPTGSQRQQMPFAVTTPPVKKQKRKARRLFFFAN